MTVTTVRIEDKLNQKLEKFCETQDRSKSWVIREALEKYLDNKKTQKKK